MRFEIRTGGVFLILTGVVGLSAVVFALGLVAGYQMGHEAASQSAPLASVFPAPSPPREAEPSASPSLAEATSERAVEGKTTARTAGETSEKPSRAKISASAVETAKTEGVTLKPRPGSSAAKPGAAVSLEPVVNVPPPTEAPVSAARTAETKRASAARYAPSLPSEGRHKPFNIQIDALMDRVNAEQLASRLQNLGYHAFLVPTDVDGKTWWRVRVGPYDSEEDATAAEQRLREQYRAAYASGH